VGGFRTFRRRAGERRAAVTELSGHALKLTVIVGEDDVHVHRPVYTEVVIRAREAGLAGATVVRGVESYGRRSLVHTSRLVSLSNDLPVVITIIDEDAKIRAFLPTVTEVVKGGIVLLEDVAVVHYVGSPEPGEEVPGVGGSDR
jgi:PII-like signaling protein